MHVYINLILQITNRKKQITMIHFSSKFNKVASILGHYSQNVLRMEPSIYSAGINYVKRNGGVLTNKILDNYGYKFYKQGKQNNLNTLIDVRLFYDMQINDYPSYPGWHADFDGSKIDNKPRGEHLVCSLSSHPEGVSNTRFYKGDVEIPMTDGLVTWQSVHKYMTDIESKEPNNFYDAKDGEIIILDNETLHTSTPAINRGVRLFMRMTHTDAEISEEDGKLSNQIAVYRLVDDIPGF